jgi:predicted metal-dependent phosphoesterase TrpH
VPKGIAWAKLCDEVHRQGGVAVAAHPYRWGQRFDEIVEKQKPALDGMELLSSNMDDRLRRLAADYHAGTNLAGLGNSDAHSEDGQGVAWTEFEVDVRTMKDLVEAIRSRKLKAVAGR